MSDVANSFSIMGDRASAQLFLTDAPAAGDLAVVADGLDEFNLQQAGTQDQRPLAVFVRDTGDVVGGLTGRTSLGVSDPPEASRVFLTRTL